MLISNINDQTFRMTILCKNGKNSHFHVTFGDFALSLFHVSVCVCVYVPLFHNRLHAYSKNKSKNKERYKKTKELKKTIKQNE